MRNPTKFYSFDGFLYGPGLPGRTVADLDRICPLPGSIPAATENPSPTPSDTDSPASSSATEESEVPTNEAEIGAAPSKDEVPSTDFSQLSMNELWDEVQKRELTPTGTGKGGAIKKSDLIRTLETA